MDNTKVFTKGPYKPLTQGVPYGGKLEAPRPIPPTVIPPLSKISPDKSAIEALGDDIAKELNDAIRKVIQVCVEKSKDPHIRPGQAAFILKVMVDQQATIASLRSKPSGGRGLPSGDLETMAKDLAALEKEVEEGSVSGNGESQSG
jgi:hypothetical protein